MPYSFRASWLAFAGLVLPACSSPQPATPAPRAPESTSPREAAEDIPSRAPEVSLPPTPPKPKPELIPAHTNDATVAPLVRAELARAEKDARQLIVYVGATWCEPCQRFKQALKGGQLNQAFPTLRVLEFDIDRDRASLAAAGYSSRMIPLFARPNDDGTCSDARIEGAVKGPQAIANIVPRLSSLLTPTTPTSAEH